MREKVDAVSRNIKCPVCHKSFRISGHFKRHLRMIQIGIVSENKKRHSGLFQQL